MSASLINLYYSQKYNHRIGNSIPKCNDSTSYVLYNGTNSAFWSKL